MLRQGATRAEVLKEFKDRDTQAPLPGRRVNMKTECYNGQLQTIPTVTLVNRDEDIMTDANGNSHDSVPRLKVNPQDVTCTYEASFAGDLLYDDSSLPKNRDS